MLILLKKIVMKQNNGLKNKRERKRLGKKIITQGLIFLLYFLSTFEDSEDKRNALLELNHS